MSDRQTLLKHSTNNNNAHSTCTNDAKQYDIIVIGGGVIGTTVTYYLAKNFPQLKICLLEKEAELSFGISKANSGIIHAGFHDQPTTLKGRLCARGNFLYGEWQKEFPIPFKRVGELMVTTDHADIPKLTEFLLQGEANGIHDLRIVNQTELRQLENNLSEQIVAALYAPSAGVINPYELVYILARRALCLGAEINTNSEVLGLARSSKNADTIIVYSSDKTYHSTIVINAAGIDGDKIAQMAGISTVKLIPRKGEEYLLDRKCQHLVKRIIFPLPNRKSKGILIIPTLDGTIMLGPTAKDVLNKSDLSTSANGFQDVISKAKTLIPSINPAYLISAFAGVRPVPHNSEDNFQDFIIREEKENFPGLINVIGIQSPGLTAAPAIAEEVAGIVASMNHSTQVPVTHMSTTTPQPHISELKHCPGETSAPYLKMREILTNKQLDSEEKISLIKNLFEQDHDYGEIICRCEMVTLAEIKAAILDGARTLDGIKFRTRAGMGRCQGGFCSFRSIQVLSQELHISPLQVSKRGKDSSILVADLGGEQVQESIPRKDKSAPTFHRHNSSLTVPPVVVIGAGPAGLISATEIKRRCPQQPVIVIDREDTAGGILNQCIHPGFGLIEYQEELTGPEYAWRILQTALQHNVEIRTNTTVVELRNEHNSDDHKSSTPATPAHSRFQVTALSAEHGVQIFNSSAIILGTGCRERARGVIHIPGDRPSGIFTAGLAQKLLNIDGYLPGRRVVIVGSGDIGAIMARRLTLQGAKVLAVVEIKKNLSAKPRNIIQCILDFDIPIYLEHTISNIVGRERLEKITLAKIDNQGNHLPDSDVHIECDTLLLSVGLIPENELAEMANVKLDPITNGVITNENYMSSIPGIFACGNALKIYDLVDILSADAQTAGEKVVDFLRQHNAN
ncbi:MAG: FAD-dependent oxidoreductase [Oligoflexia bacterium]|nr:FAD-dependent oxidoreductase [Oligoflexia bacterium]